MNDENTKQSDSFRKPSRRRYIIVVGIILLCIIAGYIYWVTVWEPKPDPASEKVIRENASQCLNVEKNLSINPDSLTDKDFAQITNLKIHSGVPLSKIYSPWVQSYVSDLGPTYLSDIKILEKFTNLQELEIIDVSYPPKNTTKLMKIFERAGFINMNGRNFIDLKPLENLTNLTKLDFRHSDIKNIKPLKKLKNLKSLNLKDCPNITDEQVEDLQKALPELKIYR